MSPKVIEENSDSGTVSANGYSGRQQLKHCDDANDSDYSAIGRAFEHEYEKLFSFASALIGSNELAQDIVQQAFTNTLAAIENGAQIRSMTGFLHRCVRNVAFNYKRQQPHFSVDEEFSRLCEKSPAARVEVKERLQKINSAVDDLAPSQRRAFMLAEVRGLGYSEIANTMGRSTDSVRMLLTRARRKVRAKAGTGMDHAGNSLLILAAEPGFSSCRGGIETGLVRWVRVKVSTWQSWFANLTDLGTESAIQPLTQLLVGAIVISLSSGAVEMVLGHQGAGGNPEAIVTNVRYLRGYQIDANKLSGDREERSSDDVQRPVSWIDKKDRPRRDEGTNQVSTMSSDGIKRQDGYKETASTAMARNKVDAGPTVGESVGNDSEGSIIPPTDNPDSERSDVIGEGKDISHEAQIGEIVGSTGSESDAPEVAARIPEQSSPPEISSVKDQIGSQIKDDHVLK